MIVRLIKKRKIYNFVLPHEVSGNYWITDNDYLGNTRNLINVEEFNGEWKINSDFETKIMSGTEEIESAILKDYSLYFLKINTDNEYVILYCSPTFDKDSIYLKVQDDIEFNIGNDSRSSISYKHPLVSKQHAKLTYSKGKWKIKDLSSKYGTYVNNEAVIDKDLEYGDIIFIMGLKIIVMKNHIVVNTIGGNVQFDNKIFEKDNKISQKFIEEEKKEDEVIEFYSEDDYFYRSPRFKTKIEPVNIVVDAPPKSREEDKTPVIYTIGPMLTMAMMSMTMGYSSLTGVLNGTVDIGAAAPTLVMSFAMIATMLLWPTLQKKYQKKQTKKYEEERHKKYLEYIEEKRNEIQHEMKIQRQIIIDNNLPLESVKDIVYNKKRNLWEREIDQEDFLEVRLGIGSTELEGTINIPEEHFSLEDDDLLKEVYKLGEESRTLENVPVSVSFLKSNISAIIGTGTNKKEFIDGLLLQLLSFHSYEDLKIVVLTNEQNEQNWDYLKLAPHCWNNDKSIRYFATNLDEAKEISLALEQEIQARKYKDENGKMEISSLDYQHYKPYYLIITDDYKGLRDIDLLKDVCESEINYGFSLIAISPRLINLPNECKTFISIGDKKSGVFENELVSNKQKEFDADFDLSLDMFDICKTLANIPIDIAKENKSLPQSVSFLEMYNVGMVDQLNILNRWKSNDPTKSLQTPVGFDKSRELFKLDLHEKFHGPHGLIAGMTGSGKSEFIISYILSMALNYHPYEVSFVLIDYKGGGLTGAFENKETGMKLPHLAGTITNLDTIEMNRSLASIQSELRKRQKMFNEARDKLDESTIDIYKYQSLYRKGLVDKPISHLFIISDEFAELKDQRPEFMDQLISTARIGRSLGVHLILATQKPNGVVNDQIWSNAKFRVCLKVQDKSDSMDMIKVPDAASLKNPGRFYLQVGYNELFAMGQAAWAGAQYYPTEKRKKKVDTSLSIVDNVGNIIKNIETKQNEIVVESKGEEITNIIKYIIEESKKENVFIEQLWLDSIPAEIYVDKLKEKYNYHEKYNVINPVIGEYDDPDNQKQGLLTLPLSQDGNTIIYGSGGSGKELMLQSIIYSCITNHNSKEVNFYILDFGAETLTMFKNAPHVGDVILSNEEEKITNLFKLITQEIEERKKLFVEYNGSYDFYINHGGKQLPLIVIMINNVEAFTESYPDYEDLLGQITRDCLKYGIIFIFSTNGPNTVRYRLRQNFKLNLCLQFNDASDYGSVIAGVRKKEPSHIYGRGLIAMDSIYEFQTAYPYKEEKITEYVKIICNKLNDICEYKARPIAVLPEKVTLDILEDNLGNIRTVPFGIEREYLIPATEDLSKKFIYHISGQDISSYNNELKAIITSMNKVENSNMIIMDPNEILDNIELPNTIYDTTCYTALDALLKEFENKQNSDTKYTFCVLVGLNNVLSKFGGTDKERFTKIIEESKENPYMNFIFIDNIDGIKNILFEPWYKPNADLSDAIWLGNGLGNQFTIKVTTSSKLLREELPEGYGYIVKKGKASVVKLITE